LDLVNGICLVPTKCRIWSTKSVIFDQMLNQAPICSLQSVESWIAAIDGCNKSTKMLDVQARLGLPIGPK
jgi:hypothetical protein